MRPISAASRPKLRRGVRLIFDTARGTRVLLYPEGVLVPNETAAEVLARCDGSVSVAGIAASLAGEYEGVRIDDVLALLDRLAERRFIEESAPPTENESSAGHESSAGDATENGGAGA